MSTETKFQFRIAPQIAGDDIERRGRVARELESLRWTRRELVLRAKGANAEAVWEAIEALADVTSFARKIEFEKVAKAAGKVQREARKMDAQRRLEAFDRRMVKEGYATRKRVKS